MPRYDAKRIESKWQAYWDQHQTFVTSNTPQPDAKGKLYVLDMFPYPSGAGLHVGHPEGYTATDIVCRSARMRGRHVLHPMGWDAFGLPAEQHAINTGTHPSVTTYQNIDNFRRQLKMLGFSYDWTRELSTTDEDYYRWTQWIFLQLFDTWFDPEFEWTGPDGQKRVGKGRPIADLPIPSDIAAQGTDAIREYQDQHRLAYQSEAPVNWCPALGTVLANEEVTAEGKSERGNHPVERRSLRQWMLRITAYAERLLTELDDLDWPESVKSLQRNWIGRSVGAEVDFLIAGSLESPQPSTLNSQPSFEEWKGKRAKTGFPRKPENDVLRVYTTRPDTLYGATYMVVAPEHSVLDRIVTDEQQDAVEEYRKKASLKTDLDRTDLAKEKTGVFTGAHAINPVSGEPIPIWVADYVLISYGTGAIMAVPAHDERDFEFATQFDIPIQTVVQPPEEWLEKHDPTRQPDFQKTLKEFEAMVRADQESSGDEASTAIREGSPEEIASLLGNRKVTLRPEQLAGLSPEEARDLTEQLARLSEEPLASKMQRMRDDLSPVLAPTTVQYVYTESGTAINSGPYDGLPTDEFKRKITADLAAQGLARQAVNYRLRDWLFSRQRYWGEPIPVWHELGENGKPSGRVRAVPVDQLPVTLPEMEDFKPKGTPDPPLSWAPENWLYTTDEHGRKLMRETNSMPQWAGSCWYYLRFCDNRNSDAFIDPELEKYWLPVDLYIGGAEHAVLHLLYSRFWHKVLFDRGHVTKPEPFGKLVNQGMILGEAELTAYEEGSGEESPQLSYVSAKDVKDDVNTKTGQPVTTVTLTADQVEKKGGDLVLKENPSIVVESRAFKMSKSRGNVINPDDVVDTYGADSLRLYEMFMGPLEQVKPWSMSGVEGVYRFLGRVWRMIVDDQAEEVTLHSAVQDVSPSAEQERVLHKTIKAVTEDIDKLSFNTAISRMMEFTNAFTSMETRPKACMESFVLLLSPFAPHIAEELWQVLGHSDSLTYAPWPTYDESKLVESELEIPVQVNGKLRSKIKIPADADQQTMQSLAEADEAVQSHLSGKQIVKVICVPKKMVNFVVKG